MNFAETEGTGITQRAETEGTGISRSLTRLMTMGFMLMLMAPMAMAGELRLFSHDQEYVKGIYSEGTQAVFVEGLIVGNQLQLIAQSSLIDSTEASDEGTGGKEASDEGTGGKLASDEGTGGSPASDEGTGGRPASDEGTGGSPASDEGTGGRPASDEGTGGYTLFDQGDNQTTQLILKLDCSSNLASGTVNDGQQSIDINTVQVYLNGQVLNCGQTPQ